MTSGLRVFDSNGVLTLDTDDFTIRSLAKMVLAGQNAGGSGSRSDYVLMDVPGYDPSTCYVLIKPNVYAGRDQGAGVASWPVLPTYAELGGGRIAIYTYVNYRQPTGVGSNYTEFWRSYTVACTIEAVRVL